jgi:hypothetical protein
MVYAGVIPPCVKFYLRRSIVRTVLPRDYPEITKRVIMGRGFNRPQVERNRFNESGIENPSFPTDNGNGYSMGRSKPVLPLDEIECRETGIEMTVSCRFQTCLTITEVGKLFGIRK